MKQHQVPDNQRMDYVKFVDLAFRYAHDIEPKLPYYYYVLQDIEMIRKLVAIVRIYPILGFLHYRLPLCRSVLRGNSGTL